MSKLSRNVDNISVTVFGSCMLILAFFIASGCFKAGNDRKVSSVDAVVAIKDSSMKPVADLADTTN